MRDNYKMSMADNGYAAMMTRWDRDRVRIDVLSPLGRVADRIRDEDQYD